MFTRPPIARLTGPETPVINWTTEVVGADTVVCITIDRPADSETGLYFFDIIGTLNFGGAAGVKFTDLGGGIYTASYGETPSGQQLLSSYAGSPIQIRLKTASGYLTTPPSGDSHYPDVYEFRAFFYKNAIQSSPSDYLRWNFPDDSVTVDPNPT